MPAYALLRIVGLGIQGLQAPSEFRAEGLESPTPESLGVFGAALPCNACISGLHAYIVAYMHTYRRRYRRMYAVACLALQAAFRLIHLFRQWNSFFAVAAFGLLCSEAKVPASQQVPQQPLPAPTNTPPADPQTQAAVAAVAAATAAAAKLRPSCSFAALFHVIWQRGKFALSVHSVAHEAEM